MVEDDDDDAFCWSKLLETTPASWWKLHLLCQQLAFGSHTPLLHCRATCSLHNIFLCTACCFSPQAALCRIICHAVILCFTAFHCAAYIPSNALLHAKIHTIILLGLVPVLSDGTSLERQRKFCLPLKFYKLSQITPHKCTLYTWPCQNLFAQKIVQ